MRCKDVQNEPILKFLMQLDGSRGHWFCDDDGNPLDGRSVLNAMPRGTPAKVAKAKMANLIKKGLVSGCNCGCRGDYVLTEAGMSHIYDITCKQN